MQFFSFNGLTVVSGEGHDPRPPAPKAGILPTELTGEDKINFFHMLFNLGMSSP